MKNLTPLSIILLFALSGVIFADTPVPDGDTVKTEVWVMEANIPVLEGAERSAVIHIPAPTELEAKYALAVEKAKQVQYEPPHPHYSPVTLEANRQDISAQLLALLAQQFIVLHEQFIETEADFISGEADAIEYFQTKLLLLNSAARFYREMGEPDRMKEAFVERAKTLEMLARELTQRLKDEDLGDKDRAQLQKQMKNVRIMMEEAARSLPTPSAVVPFVTTAPPAIPASAVPPAFVVPTAPVPSAPPAAEDPFPDFYPTH